MENSVYWSSLLLAKVQETAHGLNRVLLHTAVVSSFSCGNPGGTRSSTANSSTGYCLTCIGGDDHQSSKWAQPSKDCHAVHGHTSRLAHLLRPAVVVKVVWSHYHQLFVQSCRDTRASERLAARHPFAPKAWNLSSQGNPTPANAVSSAPSLKSFYNTSSKLVLRPPSWQALYYARGEKRLQLTVRSLLSLLLGYLRTHRKTEGLGSLRV